MAPDPEVLTLRPPSGDSDLDLWPPLQPG